MPAEAVGCKLNLRLAAGRAPNPPIFGVMPGVKLGLVYVEWPTSPRVTDSCQIRVVESCTLYFFAADAK